jgi:hypothetical protein
MPERRLSKAAIEELADARLVLETASHNLNALVRGKLEALGPDADVDQALANAHRQLEQVVATLARVRAGR